MNLEVDHDGVDGEHDVGGVCSSVTVSSVSPGLLSHRPLHCPSVLDVASYR